jgi:hypothetical protein
VNKCYEYHTSVGTFSIVQHQSCYHAVFSGISIYSCYSAAEVAAVLSNGYKFSLPGAELGEIDTSDLRIPIDLSGWIRCYLKWFC